MLIDRFSLDRSRLSIRIINLLTENIPYNAHIKDILPLDAFKMNSEVCASPSIATGCKNVATAQSSQPTEKYVAKQQIYGIPIPLKNRFAVLASKKRTDKKKDKVIMEEIKNEEQEVVSDVEIKEIPDQKPQGMKPTARFHRNEATLKSKADKIAKKVSKILDDAGLDKEGRIKDSRFDVDKRKYFTPRTDFGVKITAVNDEVVIEREKTEFVRHEKLDNDYIPKSQEVIEKATKIAQQKQNAREQYKKRSKGILSVKNMKQFKDYSVLVRLNLHNKRHKCPCHKLRFNRVIVVTENEIDFVCDRAERKEQIVDQKEIHDWFTPGMTCPNCRQGQLSKVIKDLCDCKITLCDWCFYQTYSHATFSNIVCQCTRFKEHKMTMDMVSFLEQNRKTRALTKGNKWSDLMEKDVYKRAKREFASNEQDKKILAPIVEEDKPYELFGDFPLLIDSHGDDDNYEFAKKPEKLGDIGQPIHIVVVKMIRKKPEWTKPKGEEDYHNMMCEIRDLPKHFYGNTRYFYDYFFTKFYLHCSGFNKTTDFEYNWQLYGNLITQRVRFDKEEAREIFFEPIPNRFFEVKSPIDLISFLLHFDRDYHLSAKETGLRIESHGNIITGLSNTCEASGDAIIEIAKTVFNKLKGIIQTAKDKFVQFAANVVYHTAQSCMGPVMGKIIGFMSDFVDAFNSMIEWTVDFFYSDVFEGMACGIPTLYLLIDSFTNPTPLKWLSLSPLFMALYKFLMEKYTGLNVDRTVLYSLLLNVFSTVVFIVIRSRENEIQSHSDDDKTYTTYTPNFTRLTSLFTDALGKLKIPILGYGKFLSTMREFNTIVAGCKNVGTLLMSILEFMPKFVKNLFKSVSPAELLRQELKDTSSPFYRLSRKTIEVSAYKALQDFQKATECKMDYVVIKKELYDYMAANDIAHSTEIGRFLSSLDAAVRVPYSPADSNKQPFIVRLVGDAGVGKSTLSLGFLSALKGETTDEVEKKTYYRNPGTEYWDGKVPKHKYCIYDDFNQDRNETDLQELILLASESKFYAPFSSVDPADQSLTGMKGDVVGFDAIVLCGNTVEIRANTLNSNEAINRRKHLIFNLEFINRQNKTAQADWSHLKIQLLDNTDYKPVKDCTWYGLEGIQTAQAIVNAVYEMHMKRVDVVKENIKNLSFDKSILEKLNYGKANPIALNHIQARQADIERVCARYERNHRFEPQRLGGRDALGLAGLDGIESHSDEITIDAAYDVGMRQINKIQDMEQRISEKAAKAQWERMLDRIWQRIKEADFKETSFFGKIFSGFKFIFKQSLKWWMPIGATVGAIAAVFAMFGWKSVELHSGERQNNKVGRIKMHVRSHGEETSFLKNNVGKIIVGSTRQRNVNFIFVKSNIILLNAHVFWNLERGTEFVEDGTSVSIKQENVDSVDFKFDHTQISEIDEDLILYKLPDRVPARSTITQHFWDGGMNLETRDVIMYRHDGQVVKTYYGKITKDQVQVTYSQTRGGKEVEILTHNTCLTNLPSSPGDCGSMIVVPTGLPNSFRIIGINIGKGPSGSITKLITREMVVTAANKYTQVIERAELHSSWQKPTAEDIENSGFVNTKLVIHAISSKEISVPRKSKIKPSPLYDLIVEPKTDICILNMNDSRLGGVNVFKENMLKYGSPSMPFPQELIKEAVDSIISELNAKKTIRLTRCLTTFEAINGVPGYPYLTSLEMTTSPAFPFTLEGILGEKRQLFDGEPGRYVPNANLQKHIDIIESRISNNIFPDYPFLNTIKDERKDREDVAKGKSRMFSMASVALTIVQRKYCLPIIAHLYQCRSNSFLSIGINKASREWDQMVRYLLEVGDDFSDADYKKFDTRANLEARIECNRIFFQKWMTAEEISKINVLLRYDAQALHQWGKYILAIPSGTSSGSFITATIGSMLNETYIRMAWIRLMPGGFRDISMYRRYVRTKNYGDDLVMTVNKQLKEFFHPKAIAEWLASFGIEMTSGDKKSELGFKTVKEFTFLKNKTVVFHGSYVPLQQDPEEPINWIRVGANSETPEVACEANCNSVLRTLFFYGEKRFNEIRDKILEFKDYNLISYSSLLAEWFEIGEISDPDGTFTFSEGRSSIATILENSKKYSRTPPGKDMDGQRGQSNMNFEIIPEILNIESHSGVHAEGTQGTIDDPAAVSDVRFGTVTTDQTSPAMVSRVEGRTISTTARSSKYNPDGVWDLAKMLGRWNYVDTVIWKTTDAVGASIVTLDIIADLLTSEIAITPFQRFNLARFSQIQIKLETVGYRFARGRLLVCFRPTQRPKAKISSPPSINDAIVLQAISLDPTAATIGQLNIDFTYYKQYIDLVNDDCLGQLHFIVQNAFTPGTAGSNECGIKVFFNLENAMFKQPRPAEATYNSHLLPLRIQSHSGLIDEAAKELKGLVHDILPDNIIGDALGGLLDAPQLGEQIPPLVNKQIQYFNNAKNPQYVDVLTLDPSSQQLVDKDVFSTGVNEMMIPELLKKCQFVKTVQWAATDSVGKILFTDNVGPMSDVPKPATGNFVLGMLSYISSFFTYWRGSIVYFIEIVGTQFHEGKLDFCFHPQISATTNTGLSYKSRMSQYFRTVHIRNGSNVFGFRAIYPGDSPVKLVHNGVDLSDGPSDTAYRFQNYFSGSVSLVVSTLLNAPETVQPNVEVNIYKMAGPDYELFMNTAIGSSLQPVGETPTIKIKSHGDDQAIDRNTNWFQMETETLGVGANMAGDIASSHFGEYFHSLRDMCKRYTLSFFATETIALNDTEIVNGTRPLAFGIGLENTNFGKSFIAKVAAMFRNFRGATVHKVKVSLTFDTPTVQRDLEFTGLITQLPSSDADIGDMSQAYRNGSHFLNFQPHAYVSNEQVAEFKAPFLSSRTSTLVAKTYDDSFSPYESESEGVTSFAMLIWPKFPASLTADTNNKLNVKIEWMSALSDEATYGVFTGIPQVYVALANGGVMPPDKWPITTSARRK